MFIAAGNACVSSFYSNLTTLTPILAFTSSKCVAITIMMVVKVVVYRLFDDLLTTDTTRWNILIWVNFHPFSTFIIFYPLFCTFGFAEDWRLCIFFFLRTTKNLKKVVGCVINIELNNRVILLILRFLKVRSYPYWGSWNTFHFF